LFGKIDGITDAGFSAFQIVAEFDQSFNGNR
jgi:hypothetical protein